MALSKYLLPGNPVTTHKYFDSASGILRMRAAKSNPLRRGRDNSEKMILGDSRSTIFNASGPSEATHISELAPSPRVMHSRTSAQSGSFSTMRTDIWHHKRLAANNTSVLLPEFETQFGYRKGAGQNLNFCSHKSRNLN